MKLAKKITTAAALAAALLAGTAPKAAAQCPYTVGPLGRYVAPAIVQGMTATDDGGHGQRWHRSRCRRSSVTACAGGAPSGAFLSRRRRGQILHFTG